MPETSPMALAKFVPLVQRLKKRLPEKGPDDGAVWNYLFWCSM